MKISLDKKLTALFIFWILIILGSATVAPFFLPYKPSFPYSDFFLTNSGLPYWLYSFANFDGVHYLTIVGNGYESAGLIQAFFPMYPAIVFLVSQFVPSAILAGLLVSFSATVLLITVFYKLLRIDFSKVKSFNILGLFLLFPTSFYLLGMYTESLFLLFVVLSFYFVRTQRYAFMAIFAALATATRITGVALIPALMLDVYLQHKKAETGFDLYKEVAKSGVQLNKFFKTYKTALFLAGFGIIGLLSYMSYLAYTFNDPLLFLHVQEEFGAQRSESLILLPQTLWRGLKILVFARPFDLKYYAYAQEFIISIATLGVLVYGLKTVRFSYLLYAGLAFLLPTFTGTLSSMPRYVLLCFPVFIIVNTVLASHTRLRYTVLILSGILLVMNTVLFVQGYWIA